MDSSPPISPTTVSPSAVGAALRRRRQELNLSLQDVAEQLCIRQNYLEALEEGDFNHLPLKTYASGFVRSYAQYLDLDSVSLSTQFNEEFSKAARKEEHHLTPRPVPEGRFPGARILWIAAGSTVVAFGLWLILVPSGHEKIDVPSPPTTTVTVTESQTPSPATTVTESIPSTSTSLTAVNAVAGQTTDTQSLPRSSSTVSVKALSDSWIEIRTADDELLVSKVLKAGETYDIPRYSGLKLATGNAGGIVLLVENQTFSHLGPESKVMRNIPLDAKALLKRFQVTSPSP